MNEMQPPRPLKKGKGTVYRIRDSSEGDAVADFYDVDAMMPYIRWAKDFGFAEYQDPPFIEIWYADAVTHEPVGTRTIDEAIEEWG